MAPNKRNRDRLRNPQPFLTEDENQVPKKQHSKARKRHHQEDDTLLSSGMSSKIFREARIQQKENEIEARNELHANPFSELPDEDPSKDDEEDIDNFIGFFETQTQIGTYEEEDIAEEDERLVEAFLSKDAGPQHTLADLIVKKIKENDAVVSSDSKPLPKLDTSVIDLYKGVGKSLNKYMAGKVPKAFKRIPSMPLWEEVLYLTEPDNWSPNAMFQATRIFASNLGVKKVEKFYKLVLLPAVRKDIQKNKRLHFALYQALKKSLYKPTAFFKGILLPLCESGTCNLREAVIVGSIIEKVTIPVLHSSVALFKLAEMEYCGTTSYFIKLILEKKYALPYRVVDAVVAHFVRFLEETRVMPVIWHQSLLAFVQRYKNELRMEDKSNIRFLLQSHRHKDVTPEIMRELNNSRSRGEKDTTTNIL